ncbi:hypothetical protein M758_1G254300 [Ceratodon purpureus]|nr:hypothetical protein M758_1G254300 [Ceratodon purpureus]
MAEKAPNEEEPSQEAEASRQESFLDQFLRRLDQTDQEAAASPSTSGTTMAAPSPSSEYSSLTTTANPWNFMSTPHPGSPLNPDLQTAALQNLMYRSSAPSAYSLPTNPLAEFPWLLEEFDQQQRMVAGDPDAHDSAQRLYSSYTTHELGQVLGPSGGSPSSSQGGPFKDEPASSHTNTRKESSSIQAGGHRSSSSKLDAGPVPRFGEPGSTQPAKLQGSPSSAVSKQMNYTRLPTSPLLSEATAPGVGAGSVTTSAGTSNTSLSSESTSNAVDEDESEVKKEVATEGASSGKRKKPEAEGGGAGETPESKKSDQPKNKPRKRGGAKRLREPRYAIKTRTDVDVLDDGFKWRKYGQKAVKNSPHPRNYYRCTTPLCPVRKRVERSNEDSGLVITTYEGTHTHQTPGFHRPSAGGYFGDRPMGMGGGLFQSPLGPSSTLLPLPPGFDLASLQQATALRNIRGLQPNQNPSLNLLPGSSSQQQQFRQQLGFQQESLFRAQQFLGLQDGSPFGSVKQEPFQFTAQDFMTRNLSMPSLPGMTGGPNPSQMLNRSISDHLLQRPGGSPLFSGLNFPHLQSSGGNLNISRPASSSNISSDNRGHQQGRHELQPGAGVGAGSSSRIDQSLETLVSSSSVHPNFNDQAQGGAGPDQPQPGRSNQSRGGQQRTPMPTMQQHQQQHQHIRSAGPSAGGLSSSVSSENLQGQVASESETGAREGLLQDMVRHGGPKVSKS